MERDEFYSRKMLLYGAVVQNIRNLRRTLGMIQSLEEKAPGADEDEVTALRQFDEELVVLLNHAKGTIDALAPMIKDDTKL